MPERAVTVDNLGAWMIKCNPAVWDFATFIRDGAGPIHDWSVNPSYRTELMESGQRMLLWVTGQDGHDLEPGLWGTGIVTGRVQREELDDEPHLWLDEDQRQRSRYFVPIDVQLLPDPIPRRTLRADPRLAGMEILRQPQMGNPLVITIDELAALEDHLDLPPVTVTVDESGAGFGDPATRAKVENAAVNAARRHYRRRGWAVKDVSKEKLGWDLDCTSPQGDVHHVEVKGVSGAAPAALLTRNEARAAKVEHGWRLVIVTQALDNPQLHLVDGPTAVEASTPFVYQVDLTNQ